MTRDEILAYLPHLTGCETNLGALSYHVATLNWYQGPFYDFFRQRYWNEGLSKWKVRWECRDFAAAYRLAAVECWALTNDMSEDDGLSAAEIWYIPDSTKAGSGHAINPVFTENGLQFIDPQINSVCVLNTSQLYSRYFLRF